MREELKKIRDAALADLASSPGEAAIEAVRVRYLGRKGELTTVMKQMRDVAPEAVLDKLEAGRKARRKRRALDPLRVVRPSAFSSDFGRRRRRGLGSPSAEAPHVRAGASNRAWARVSSDRS